MSTATARAADVTELLPNIELASAPAAAANQADLGGLRSLDGRPFPLKRVQVRTAIAGPCARTKIKQEFANPFDEPLDVTWIFPLPADGALVELELRAGEILIKGECLERGAAKATFDAASAQGKRTALVEKELGDVHTLSLAGLPAGSEVTIQFTLVQLLPSVNGRFLYQFPTTIAPRYTPGLQISHEGFGTEADTDVVRNASRLTPPIRLTGGTELDLEIEIAGPLTTLESSQHAVKLALDNGSVRVAPSARATLSKDFILAFSTADSATATTRAWSDGAHALVLLEPPARSITRGLPRDAVFAIDISGSMGGEKLDAAKSALVSALHGLNEGDRFKLVAFDDRIERFRPDFSDYTDRNVDAADGWINALVCRGGTEMLLAIQESLDGATPAGRLRTVLLITDGQSNDENRLLPAVANRRNGAVLFTLGIDTAVNAALLKTLARAGGGTCELCTPHDDIDAVVARLEARFGNPLVSDIKVGGAARPDGQTVFAGRPASILIETDTSNIDVSGVGPDGAFQTTITPTRIPFQLGELWAMERVAWLEERLALRPFEEEAIRPEIVRVALRHHIASKFTSFVCVDHSAISNGERRHVIQPTEMPDAWDMDEEMPIPTFGGSFGRAVPQQNVASSYQNGVLNSRDVAEMEKLLDSMPGVFFCRAQMDRNESPLPAAPSAPAPIEATPILSKLAGALGEIFDVGKKKSNTPTGNRAPAQKADKPQPTAGNLARTQSANGSFGNDVGRTSAALLALMMLGNTRRKGDRQRSVQKAVEWLQLHVNDARAALALRELERTELSGFAPVSEWRTLANEGDEGDVLRRLLEAHGV